MNEMEMKARANHRNGNNCSASLAMAFAEKLGMSEAEAKSFAPAPRSIDGKKMIFQPRRIQLHWRFSTKRHRRSMKQATHSRLLTVTGWSMT